MWRSTIDSTRRSTPLASLRPRVLQFDQLVEGVRRGAQHPADHLPQPILRGPALRRAADPEDAAHDHVERDRLHPGRERERLVERPLVDLALGHQQQVEIIKALWRGSRVLILDEPTSMLTPQGVAELTKVLGRLKEQGQAVVFITHKLHEALSLGDFISILRQGRLAGTIDRRALQTKPAEELRQIRRFDSGRVLDAAQLSPHWRLSTQRGRVAPTSPAAPDRS